MNAATPARYASLAFAAAASLIAGCATVTPVQELRTHANESFSREEYKRAVAFDTEILRRSPDDFAATVQRGVAYDRLGNVADAQADYTRAIEMKPDAGLPRLYRANLALKTGHMELASTDVSALKGVELEPHEQIATLCLEGTIAQRRADWKGALRPYQAAIETGRTNVDPASQKHYRDALNNASECYYRLGDFDRSAALYGEVVQAKVRSDEPVTEDDHYTMGVLSYLRGDFPRSKHHFAKVSPNRKKQAAKLLNDEGFFASAK